jgi:hypothetical protein
MASPGDEGKFKQLQAAELKHGRVAMLASVGLLAQCYIRLPWPGTKKLRDFRWPWDLPSGNLLHSY